MSCWRLDNKLLSVTTTHIHGLKSSDFFIFRQMKQLTFPPEASWWLCYSTLRFSRHFKGFFWVCSSSDHHWPLLPQHCWRVWLLTSARKESKLTSQVYGGAAVMRGAKDGVQTKVKDVYTSACCYMKPLHAGGSITQRQDQNFLCWIWCILLSIIHKLVQLWQTSGSSRVTLLTLCMSWRIHAPCFHMTEESLIIWWNHSERGRGIVSQRSCHTWTCCWPSYTQRTWAMNITTCPSQESPRISPTACQWSVK